MGNFYLYKIAYIITRALPLSWAYAMASLLADVHYSLSKKDRLSVEANLEIILKQDHISDAQVRDVFRNFGKYLVDFFTMTKRVTPEYIKDHIKVKNGEYINEALAHGKGGILVSAHVGNWELAGGVLASLGYPVSVIALPHKDPRVNKFFNDQREFFGIKVIPTNVAIRRCMEDLKDNRCMAILGERDFSEQGIQMDFLGTKTIIPRGAALFAFKTGAPIIPVFFIRKSDDNFYFEFHKPIYPPYIETGKISEEQVVALIKEYLKFIEENIRAYPTQWLMFREFGTS